MRAYQVLKHPEKGYAAVKRGFSWPGFFFTWIWAATRGLWLVAGGLFILALGEGLLGYELEQQNPWFVWALALAIGLWIGAKGNLWRTNNLLDSGYQLIGAIKARGAQAATANVAAAGGVIPAELKAASKSGGLISVPAGLQGMLAIITLTWQAAFRYRLFWVIALLLVGAVVGLPILIKDDGTAEGFAQILITYTLAAVTGLLGMCTLWLACGTMARDVEECQIQMVAVKPIARWQIWLGKWLGIVSLNAALLIVAGACIYGLLEWRAQRLPAPLRNQLQNEVLVSRASAREDSLDSLIDSETDRLLAEQSKKGRIEGVDLNSARQLLREQVKAAYQVVGPDHLRGWVIHLGRAADSLRDKPLFLRTKFNVADLASHPTTYMGIWQIGVAQKTHLYQTEVMSLSPDTFHEFPIPPNLFDAKGDLTIVFRNLNPVAMLFPLDEGMEVLYRQGGFGFNFIRGLVIILSWMALLAALGLASASFLSFPVAAFCSVAMLIVCFSSGTLATAVQNGTIVGYDTENGQKGHSPADYVMLPVFRGVLGIINLAQEFSPIESLSTGRAITWGQLGLAVTQIVLVLGGIMAAFGIFVFNRRELATAQGTQ